MGSGVAINFIWRDPKWNKMYLLGNMFDRKRISASVPIKLIFFSKSAFLLGTCWFIFNFAIVKHAKIANFLGTWCHTKILVETLISANPNLNPNSNPNPKAQ